MSKITLVWIDNPDKPSRRFSVPKAAIYSLLGGFFLFLTASVILLFLTSSYYSDASRLSTENARLTMMLSDKQARADQLAQELEQIQSVETKIRRFLGLNEKVSDKGRAHQGGFSGVDYKEYLNQGVICHGDVGAEYDEYSMDTDSLLDNLREVLGFLNERHRESLTIPMILPVASKDAWIAGSFGYRIDPFTGVGKEMHRGLDIAAQWKTAIIAPADGKVVFAGKNRYLGNYVKIRHSSEYMTLYGHMASNAVKKGDRVVRGDIIGYMGNTGRSTGTHLHYTVFKNRRPVNPLNYIWDHFNNSMAYSDQSYEKDI